MFTITHTQNGQESVVLGPVNWNPRFITSVIEDDFEINLNLVASDVTKVPYSPHPDIKIYPASEVIPAYDNLIQKLDGPFWTFTATEATATYTVKDEDIGLIRSKVKNTLAQKRYQKEISGTKVTVQGIEVTVETDRDTRNVFVQALLLMGDTETRNWKFPEGFVNLTKADLGIIVGSGAMYIQGCFDKELTLAAQIDTALAADMAGILVTINDDVSWQ